MASRISMAKKSKLREPKIRLADRVKGIAKGTYGKGEEYIEKERQTWKRTRS